MDKYHTPQNAVNEGIVLASTLYGTPSELTARPEGIGPNAARATWSTAPYIPPKVVDDTSRCAEEGCRGWSKGDTGFCRWHQPKVSVSLDDIPD